VAARVPTLRRKRGRDDFPLAVRLGIRVIENLYILVSVFSTGRALYSVALWARGFLSFFSG
jgi:hypothetical protein